MALSSAQTLRRSKPLTFREWIRLEEIREDVLTAAERGTDDFPDLVYTYLSAVLLVPAETFDQISWVEALKLFLEAYSITLPDLRLPLLHPNKVNKEATLDWDYKGRFWHYWTHLLAKEYGWSLEYIGDLDVNTALAAIQEILTDQQLQKEFAWSLSEIAYPYNKHTKKAEFQPLTRPYWMLPEIKKPKKIKILKRLLPQGNVIEIGKPNEVASPPQS